MRLYCVKERTAPQIHRLFSFLDSINPSPSMPVLRSPAKDGTEDGGEVIAFIEAEDVIEKILQRRTSPQTPRPMGAHAQAPPKRQIAAFVNRAPYKERRAKSLERRAEHRYPGSLLSTLCSLLLALCSQCGPHTCLCVTAPVCVQRTGRRRQVPGGCPPMSQEIEMRTGG